MRSPARSSFPFLAPLALALATSVASGPSARAEDAAVPEARTLFKEGVRLYSTGDYERARVKFAAAHALVKSEDVVWNLALAEAKSGHAADAMNHLHAYVRAPKARAGDVREARARWIPMLEPQVAELDVTGTEGTSVSVDGSDTVGVLPLADPWAVKAGHHRVGGKLGSEVTSREVDVASGQTIGVSLVLASAQPPPAPVVVPVAVAPTPSPPTPEPAPVAATPPPEPEPTWHEEPMHHPSSNAFRTWMTVGLGMGAVALAAGGVYFGMQSQSNADDAHSRLAGLPSNGCAVPTNPGCATLSSDVSSANSDHTVAVVMYVGAGALAAGAIASWLLLPKTVERAGFAPMVAPGQVGGAWVTSF